MSDTTELQHQLNFLKNNQKAYIAGNTYNGITINVTCPNAGFNLVRGIFSPYKTLETSAGNDSTYRLRFQGYFSQTASGVDPVLTITGITSKNITGWIQVCYQTNGADTNFSDYRSASIINPNTNTIHMRTATATAAHYAFSLDFELDSKPTWMDDII